MCLYTRHDGNGRECKRNKSIETFSLYTVQSFTKLMKCHISLVAERDSLLCSWLLGSSLLRFLCCSFLCFFGVDALALMAFFLEVAFFAVLAASSTSFAAASADFATLALGFLVPVFSLGFMAFFTFLDDLAFFVFGLAAFSFLTTLNELEAPTPFTWPSFPDFTPDFKANFTHDSMLSPTL